MLMKLLFTTLMLFSFSHATHTFEVYDDLCEKTEIKECLNESTQVKNLQLALNKNLNLNLETDGQWGESTKKAVLKFQEKYGLTPVSGYVGKKTKHMLDRVSRNIHFAKIDVSKPHKSSVKIDSYAAFKRKINLKTSFKVYKNEKLLSQANHKNTQLKIDISTQRLSMLVNGKVALSSPCTTGAKHKLEPNTKTYRDKHTPLGTFKIMEKVAAKKSTIFGEMYRNGKKVYHGDRRKYRGPKAKYVGHTMHNWMRLTSGGIGLHASKYVKRYPGSNGCVRLQPKIAKVIFSKVRRGTKVSIVN